MESSSDKHKMSDLMFCFQGMPKGGIFVNKYEAEACGCCQAQLVFWELLESFLQQAQRLRDCIKSLWIYHWVRVTIIIIIWVETFYEEWKFKLNCYQRVFRDCKWGYRYLWAYVTAQEIMPVEQESLFIPTEYLLTSSVG